MELVLDHEVRREQRCGEQVAGTRFGRPVEAVIAVAVGAAQQRPGRTGPGQGRELVDRGDQECRKAPVDRFVDGHDGERPAAVEVAGEADAADPEVGGSVLAGDEAEGIGGEPFAAPRAILQRDRAGVAPGIPLEGAQLRQCRIGPGIPDPPQHIRGGGLADPQADLERPLAVASRVRLPDQFQGADQGRCPAKLVKGQQPQRVAHDHRNAGAAPASVGRVPQPPDDHGEGREPEVRLGLATTRGEEEQVDGLPSGQRVAGPGDAGDIQEDEGELECPPARGLPFTEAPGKCPGDRPVGNPEGVQRTRIGAQQVDAGLDPPGGVAGQEEEPPGGRVPLGVIPGRPGHACLLGGDPFPVAGDQWQQRLTHGLGSLECAQCLHGEFDAGDCLGPGLLDGRIGNPGGAHRGADRHAVWSRHIEVPVARDAVAGRELAGTGVVEVGHLVVPVGRKGSAEVGTRGERQRGPYFETCLEGVLQIRGTGIRCAVVEQEDRDRAGARRDPGGELGCIEYPGQDVDLKAGGTGNPVDGRPFPAGCAGGWHGDHHGLAARQPVPAGRPGRAVGHRPEGCPARRPGGCPGGCPARGMVAVRTG